METSYRLREYKIIESGINELNWEAHFGLGAFQRGKCFRKGSILFIGPPEYANAGFLKGEFLDHISKLPIWLKTSYYCKGLDVYHCDSGHKVSIEEVFSWMLEKTKDSSVGFDPDKPENLLDKISGMTEKGEAAFRLQRYKIVKKAVGDIFWITHAGFNSGTRGKCVVLEDILFIESFQNEPLYLDKRSFQASLQRLPRWNQTRFYSPKLSLLDCKTGCQALSNEKRKEKKFSAGKNQKLASWKKTNGIIISERGDKKIGSEGVSDIIYAIYQVTATYRDRIRSLWLKCKGTDIPNRIKEICFTSVLTWAIYILALILLMIALPIRFLMGIWEKYRKKIMP